jgi:hypothetical protein
LRTCSRLSGKERSRQAFQSVYGFDLDGLKAPGAKASGFRQGSRRPAGPDDAGAQLTFDSNGGSSGEQEDSKATAASYHVIAGVVAQRGNRRHCCETPPVAA